MSDNNSLNEKYGRFEDEPQEIIEEAVKSDKKEKKPKKEKAKKEPKPKKEKAPKEKKVKEPKEPKEKKVKEKKVKEKKEKHGLKAKKDRDNTILPVEENSQITENAQEVEITPTTTPRVREEIVFTNVNVENIDFSEEVEETQEAVEENTENAIESLEEKKSEKPKKKKEKKAKEKKPKKEKVKKEKVKKEKKPREPIAKKDVITIITAVIAIILAVVLGSYMYFNSREESRKIELVKKYTILGKFFPEYVFEDEKLPEQTDDSSLSKIQLSRRGLLTSLIQSDVSNVFYGIDSEYKVHYYQRSNDKILAIPSENTEKINLNIDMGSATLNVEMNYLKSDNLVFGVGVFTSNDEAEGNYYYNLVVFKMTNLPSSYQKENHVLLLATTDSSALYTNDIAWSESFDLNLETGATTRFLSVINRSVDEKGAGVDDFCMLPRAGYTSSSTAIPFISSREYTIDSNLQDLFVKSGNKETVFASNIYGKYFVAEKNIVAYFRRNTTGFDVIHNVNGEEKIFKSFYGYMGTNYMIIDKYLLSKGDGHIYNIISGKEYTLVGFSMSTVDSYVVTPDGKYLVMIGTVKNALDYQVHIFDLQTGEYEKFVDKNYARHYSLYCIDKTTVAYSVADPNQGFEYVLLDISKAFAKE